MLYEWAKNKTDEQKARELWNGFTYKNGHKGINPDNFLDMNYTYCSYKIEKRYYKGYFKKDEIDLIVKVLDYYEGRIRGLCG